MKNKEGITLISLVITVIVLLILASIATYSGINIIKSSKYTAFTAELKIMQTHINSLYEENKNAKYGIEIENTASQVQDQAKKVFTENASGIMEMTGYRYWSEEEIKNTLKIEGVEQAFFVNLEKRSIVSYEGLEYEGETYYTLEQLPNGLYNVDYEVLNSNVPTFDVKTEMIDNDKWRISIFDIQYSGYIDKWQVSYQQETKDYWNITQDLSFVVNETGNYKIKLINGNVQSKEEIAQAGIKPGELVIKDNQKYTNNGTAIIPAGFAIVPGCEDVSQGLVITDNIEDTELPADKTKHIAKGNQFVWVPLEEPEFKRCEGYSNDQLENRLTKCTEPFEDGYKTEIDEEKDMKQSIIDNQGFYIGRYEAGKDENENVIIKKGASIYNNVPWGNSMEDIEGTTNTEKKIGAVKLAKEFTNNKVYKGKVTSTLCYGIQWDATMQFMDSNYSTGSCNENSYVRNSGSRGYYQASSPTTAGLKTEYAEKNIYDMAGNVREWTMEAYFGERGYRVIRGGDFYDDGSKYPASYRDIGDPNYFHNNIGFRICLYL